MSDEDCTEYLERIVEINQIYPGAGELEFRSQLDIFIENMLMWDRKKRMSKGVGICGVVQAFGRRPATWKFARYCNHFHRR